MGDWEDRALSAAVRRDRMMSFGPHAYGLLVKGKHGLFAVNPEDGSVTRHLLQTGLYAEHEIALADSFINSDSDVLVVGTHIGALVVPLSRLCARMDAVEANPATVELVRTNLLINRCDNVTLHPVAASDRRETLDFLQNKDNSGGSKRRPLREWDHYVYDDPQVARVDAWPLDERLATRRYDYILMDIEGSEYFALRGMQQILANSAALCVEFLPHHLTDVAGVGAAEFWSTLEPHFDWLYVPETGAVIEKEAIGGTLQAMMDRGEGHVGLCFLKQDPRMR